MKTNNNLLITLTALSMLLIYGCNTVNTSEPEISEEELEIAGEIVAGSLSEEQGGVLASVYDAFSTVSQTGISYSGAGQTLQKSFGDSSNGSGRGRESEYTANYNPDTGEHTISFTRSFEGPNMTKDLSVLNKYIFTNSNQEFLQWPRQQQDQIETIDYKGMRTGSAESERRSSSFTRIDTLFTSGMSDESTILTLDGNHNGEGLMTVDLPQLERSGERSFTVQFNFQNIQIDKAIVRENGNLEEGITGLITYSMQMSKTVDGDTTERNLTGTIELTGDGSALLRFNRFRKTFLIALRNGTLMP
jgi:hypothetical protein